MFSVSLVDLHYSDFTHFMVVSMSHDRKLHFVVSVPFYIVTHLERDQKTYSYFLPYAPSWDVHTCSW